MTPIEKACCERCKVEDWAQTKSFRLYKCGDPSCPCHLDDKESGAVQALRDCVEYCRQQNGMDECKNCGLNDGMIDKALVSQRAEMTDLVMIAIENWFDCYSMEEPDGTRSLVLHENYDWKEATTDLLSRLKELGKVL